MGTVAITGASGLLGGNLAIHLLEQGHRVVAIRRSERSTEHLAGFDIDWRRADLSATAEMADAFRGCDAVFHCAAAVSIQYRVEPWIFEANVVGTRNVMGAVRIAEVPRLIHCSTVGAIGLSEDGEPSDEDAIWNMPAFGLADAYVTTKRQAQDEVLREVRRGLDAVVVNPTYMIGPHDAKPSSGKLVVGVVKRSAPGYTLGKNNFVDVRDVARGMVTAWERGRSGETYILGGHNLTYRAFMDLVSEAAGTPRLAREVPRPIARLAGYAGDLSRFVTGKEPLLSSASIGWALTDRFIFRSDKAQAELDYVISPIEPAIESALAWFRERGYI